MGALHRSQRAVRDAVLMLHTVFALVTLLTLDIRGVAHSTHYYVKYAAVEACAMSEYVSGSNLGI